MCYASEQEVKTGKVEQEVKTGKVEQEVQLIRSRIALTPYVDP